MTDELASNDDNGGKRDASTPDDAPTSFCDTLAHYEWLLCGMGDAWGKLQSRESLLAWWLARHAVYFGLVVGLVVWVPSSVFFLIPLLLLAHIYKFGRFLVQSSLQKRQRSKCNNMKRRHTTKLQQPPPVTTFESNIACRPRDEKKDIEDVDIEAGA